MRPSPRLLILALLSGCAARSPEVAEPLATPTVAATSSAPQPPPVVTPADPGANSRKDAAIREVEQRVEHELAEQRSHPEPMAPPEPYAVCEKPAASPLLAACKPGPRAGTCSECPSYTSFAGPGTARVDLLLRGSFSGPYEEAIFVVGGCEAHANNYGGLLLTRKVEGGWAKVAYLPGVAPQRCEASPPVNGAARIACLEVYGMNSGTYVTQASLIDFRARRFDVLLNAVCEDGIDVERVRWAGADKGELRVSVTFGVQRDNDGQGCVDVGGKKRRAELTYVEASGQLAPTPATETQLRSLKVRDPDDTLDPAVAAATGASERVPPELLPERARQSFDEPNCFEL